MMDELRQACAEVAARARHVRINDGAIPGYAAGLALGAATPAGAAPDSGDRETLAAFWITLDAINFGSGWFPTLRKREGRSGYFTIATGLKERFEGSGRWSSDELTVIGAQEIAAALGQDPGHELMALFARSLR